jgi:hypothetical protein
VTIFHYRRHFRRRARQSDGKRQAAVGNEGIGLERHEFARFVDQSFGRQEIDEIGDDFLAAGKDFGARSEKRNGVGHGDLPRPT